MTESVRIIYGSKRGRTKSMAEIINASLKRNGIETVLTSVFEANPKELNKFKCIILGSSTWSNGDLQVDFIDFERGMDDVDLTGTYCAVFGPGNSRFTFFCEAVEILQAKLISCGSTRLLPSLKADELGSRIDEETLQWSQDLVTAVREVLS